MCKSQQVPLGIILKNEQKVEDMIAIMLNLHKYCPTLSIQKTQRSLELMSQ